MTLLFWICFATMWVSGEGGQVTFTVPFPPSANRYWRHSRNGVYVSEEATSYRAHAATAALVAGVRPAKGDVVLSLEFYRPRKAGDLSNRIKVLEDALNGIAYYDDAQVVELHAWRRDDSADPRVVVTLEAA